MAHKYVYFFSREQTEGDGGLKDLLGGKGAGLAEMTRLGINVPPGFTITTEACVCYVENDRSLPRPVCDQVFAHLKRLETCMDKKFGDRLNPLLVAVRSGARISMPGMMDTVLNLGLNEETVQALAVITQNERFAFDCYRRFIAMFGNVVLGIPGDRFENRLALKKKKRGIEQDTDLSVRDLKALIKEYKQLIKKTAGPDFPEDPMAQLRMAIEAVFDSWNADRAVEYRKIHNIPNEWGTAVNVQAMVFGNMGDTSGTGVVFTRNPASGEKKFFGEYLMNAQGEDVVAGTRTPEPVAQLEKTMPEVYGALVDIFQKLEKHYQDMQDLEFTVQDKQLYLLQTRSGKRTARAAIKIAADMVQEGLISKQVALMRIPCDQLEHVFHPMIDPRAKVKILARGLGASPGAASGKIVFTPERAQAMAENKEKIILVRMETSPEDIQGMNAAQGVLTAKGGMTSHAAVVARAMGKPCVSGCRGLFINEKKKTLTLGGMKFKELDTLTIDGSSGKVLQGAAKLTLPRLTMVFTQVMKWADDMRTLQVRANADTPHDALVARDFGAQGIGLCRTEHMFFNDERILYVRATILSENRKERQVPLKKLLSIQRSDFVEIFRVMEGLPVTIRLLDPPLHEFLPGKPGEIKALAKQMGVSQTDLNKKVNSLKEINPMLGHRGCRLGITFPEIYQMQTRAILEAACRLVKKGLRIFPEIMIPLVSHVNEFRITRQLVTEVAEEVIQKAGVKLNYRVGTMIELPRAALTADEIAREADFFSFGTNDLTQTLFGLSRDDAGSFLPEYIDKGVFAEDPFVTLDQAGLGQLIEIAVHKGRQARKDLHIGICGEHGGDPASIAFCDKAGIDYVSCSPFRVPTARLAAAQAAIRHLSSRPDFPAAAQPMPGAEQAG